MPEVQQHGTQSNQVGHHAADHPGFGAAARRHDLDLGIQKEHGKQADGTEHGMAAKQAAQVSQFHVMWLLGLQAIEPGPQALPDLAMMGL